MNIKQGSRVFCILILGLIASGCQSTPASKPSIFTPISANTSISNVTETPIFAAVATLPVVTDTPTLDPSLIDCFATPVSVFNDEAQEIIQTIQKAYEIEVEAVRTSDPSTFSTVFINDPRFPVSPETLDTVRRLSHNPTLQSAGWLDYKMTYFTWMREEKAPLLTEEALRTPEPTRTVSPGFVWCSPPPGLDFLSLNIEGDIAKVVIEGCGTYELTLVLVNSRWFIAAKKGLSRCYP